MSETIFPIEVTTQDIQQRIDAGEPLMLIDVREPEEFAITRIEGATLIPMGEIPASLQQLEARADEDIDRVLPPRSTQPECGALAACAGPVGLSEHGRRYRRVERTGRPVGAAVLTG